VWWLCGVVSVRVHVCVAGMCYVDVVACLCCSVLCVCWRRLLVACV
jgi:hypothetical protein